MSLQALLVSRDGEAVSVLQTVMRQLDVESEVCAELQPAVERLAEGATSAVVVDYDVEHATELLKLMRQNYPGTCVALAMVKGLSSIQAAYDMGANFVLIKPVSPDAASRSLGEATALVQRMLRRPSRLVVPTLAYVTFEGGQDPAIILDISEGGMAIQALQALEARGPLRLRFDLPGWLRNLDVAAEIVWTDSSGRAGLRFVDLSEDDKRCLQDWVRIHAADLRAPARLADHPSEQAVLPLRLVESEAIPATTAPPTVAQRLFSTLIDAAIVLLATGLFFGAFMIFARHLPVSRWAWPIAMLTPLVFWVLYLYLFLAHPRGTPGMQIAERVKADAARPRELFDLPPSPLVSASSRVLTWLEAQRAIGPRSRAADRAIPASALNPGSSEKPRTGNGLHS